MTATDAFAAVTRAAEAIRSDAAATLSVLSPGDTLRQGDVYVTLLDGPIATRGPAPSRQLAPGTTQGSRHVAEGACTVLLADEPDALAALHLVVPATRNHAQFVGPAVLAEGAWTITHPEHGNRTLPAGAYLITYQRSWADEARRQQD